MFERSLWKNPLGWAEYVVRYYWVMVGMHILVFCLQCFLLAFCFSHMENFIFRCIHRDFSLAPLAWAVLLPFFTMGGMLPITYLYAIKRITKAMPKKSPG